MDALWTVPNTEGDLAVAIRVSDLIRMLETCEPEAVVLIAQPANSPPENEIDGVVTTGSHGKTKVFISGRGQEWI